MRHPFAGVDVTSNQLEVISLEPVSRRHALGQMIFGTAGLFGATAAANAQVQVIGKPIIAVPIQVTTEAVNEEGARGRGAATTAPFGEEAGRVTSFVMPGLEDGGATRPPVRTRALNEDGAVPPRLTGALNEGGVTTNALNEEGAIKPIPKTEAVNEGGIKIQPQPAPRPLNKDELEKLKKELEKRKQLEKQEQDKKQQLQLQVQQAQPIKGQPIQLQPAPIATTLAIGEEGGVTKALNEGGVGGPVVLVPPMARDLNTQQLDGLWKQLGESEPVALQASAAIYGSKQAVTFLKDKLKSSVKAADTETVAKLIKDLDNDSFDIREQAAKALSDLGVAALPAMQEVMKQPASPEVHNRVRRLLDQSKDMPAFLQLERGVEILVALKTPDAQKLVSELAKDKPATLVTAIAAQALPRLK